MLIEFKGTVPGEVQSNGADIRFTDSNGNELNYWIESWDYYSKNAKVWVKVASIPDSTTTIIRMYYGNPGASSMSNGDRTFEFFDDLEWQARIQTQELRSGGKMVSNKDNYHRPLAFSIAFPFALFLLLLLSTGGAGALTIDGGRSWAYSCDIMKCNQ